MVAVAVSLTIFPFLIAKKAAAATNEVSSLVETPVADPYEKFLAEQKDRECEWTANRAAKRAKVHAEEIEVVADEVEEIATLRQQLDAKTSECNQLSSKLEDADERQMREQERFSEVCYVCITCNQETCVHRS